MDPGWPAAIQPERSHLYDHQPRPPACDFLAAGYEDRPWPEPRFHSEPQDTECPGWSKLLVLVEEAAADGRPEFAPLRHLSAEERAQVTTLPPTIARLKGVGHLMLYGSDLVRVLPEIGDMTALEEFTPYTSYRLHWFPYEITRCANLRRSTVSTRALNGNYKLRLPFPQVGPGADPSGGRRPQWGRPPARGPEAERPCSVCGAMFTDREEHRVWVSLRVATDVLPLLVNACSADCVARLPAPPAGYVSGPHCGGMDMAQPPPRF